MKETMRERMRERMRENTKDRILIFLFSITLIGVGAVNMVFPNAATVSEIENRKLTVLPQWNNESFLSGEYFSNIESYFTDHFINRENFVFYSKSINGFRGFTGSDNVELITMANKDEYNDVASKNKDNTKTAVVSEEENGTLSGNSQSEEKVLLQEKKKPLKTRADLNEKVRRLASNELSYFTALEPSASDAETELSRLSIAEDEALQGGMVNNFLVVNDSCYEIFGYSEKSCDYYAGAINGFAEQLPEGDKVYSIVAPSHIEFIPSEKYRSMGESQADAINYINEQFTDRISPVNIYNALGEHSDEYLYFRSDHHWTALGAYYAYTAFAKAIGDKPYDLDNFEVTEIPGFLGTLYEKTLSRAVKANPDTVTVYQPFVENEFTIYTESGSKLNYDVINMYWQKTSNKYMVFISGDNPLSIIDTALDNGKKILVFKDSYGNAFIPWLISHYDEIHIIDPRKYKEGALTYAQENDIHEFLFINYDVVIAGNKGFAKNIYRISY